MLNVKLHNLLKSVIDKAFPDVKIDRFLVEINTRELKTKHGDYNPRDKEIRIFNLSQQTDYLISTSLHELSHHCQFSMDNTTDHSKRFYEIFKIILETAVKMGVVSYDVIRTQSNANDIKMLEKHFGPVAVAYDPSMDDKKDRLIIKVSNCYSIKENLKALDYKYNGIEQLWSKEVGVKTVSAEVDKLQEIIDISNILVEPANKLNIYAIYYIVVENSFEYRDRLKAAGYRYKGYNYEKNNPWVKKIKANELETERELLNRLYNAKVKIEGKA